MATQMQGNGMMGGAVPIQLGPGQQQGAYGVQMPLGAMFPQQGQQPQQMAQPTGQQIINGNAGQSYGVENLPPVPQQPGQQPYMGQQGNFGLTPQWGAQGQPQQPGGYVQQPGHASPQSWQQPPQAYGVPYQGAAPQPLQSQQGGFQQPQPGVPQMGLNTRLDGPGIPQALRGRTLGEAIQLYSALEGNWAQRNGVAQTPAQQSLNQMGQGQQGSAVQGQPQGQSQANFWTNPDERIGNVVDRVLEQRLGPMIQQTQQQAVTQAYTVAKSGIADFSGLEGDVMQMLAGADPQSLANPATWIGAADIARGRQVRENRYQPGQQPMGVQQVQVPGQQPPQGFQNNPAMMRAQPAGQSGQMPAYGFFTESPTAPNVSQFGGNGAGGQASQLDYQAAAKFQMPIQDYMAWKVGVSGQQTNNQMNQNLSSNGPWMGGGR